MAKKKRHKQTAEPNDAVQTDGAARPTRGRFPFAIGGIVIVVAVLAISTAALRDSMKLDTGVVSDAPLKPFKVANAHEHLYSTKHLDKYFQAAEPLGITRTLFVASSEYTLMGKGGSPKKGNEENTMQMLEAARAFPGKVVPFCTLHPDDADKVEKLKSYVAQGIMGLKLYTGHPNFYDRPLDCDEMQPVYAYCAEAGLPICWHVSYMNYAAEFERVLAKYPNLKVIVPHFGVTFFRPRDKYFKRFQDLLDKYPNVYTDTSFGTRKILVDGLEVVSRETDLFKVFVKKYSDRILFGTDMVVSGNKEKTAEWIGAVIHACRDMLEKDRFRFAMGAAGSPYNSDPANTEGTFRGLALDDDTLRKIYETNFEKLFPGK